MRTHPRTLVLSACLVTIAAAGSTASADVMARGDSDGREATVAFATDAGRLLITLTNSASADVLEPADVLTAVFFDIAGPGLTLVPESAGLDAGSVVHWGVSEVGGGVGGEWAYRAGLEGAPGAAAYGISAAGLQLFGPQDSFPGANLHLQAGPQGLNYGLLSAGDDQSTGNAAVTGGNPLIQNSVVFSLSGLPDDFDLGSISNVMVQYGTSLSEPSIPTTIISVPAPGAAAVLAGGLLVWVRRRRMAAAAA